MSITGRNIKKTKYRYHKLEKRYSETFNYAITPPFKKCIIPECFFTYITEDTLNSHIQQLHNELLME